MGTDNALTSRLARLKSYQIAGLTVVISTIAAIAVFLAFEWKQGTAEITLSTQPGDGSSNNAPRDAMQPAIDTVVTSTHVPRHFSEDVVLPGLTETGADIAHEDATKGRSPEGV